MARRRSGGGAVWLAPHEQVWVDVVLPAGDSLWQNDVRRSALWLGEVWASICGPGATVWSGPMRDQAASGVACFAGVGSGEVTLAGSKLVGISQRRTARLARFQCVAYLSWDPHPFVDVLDSGDPQVLEALSHRVATLGVGADDGEVAMWDVVGRLLNAMP